MLKMQKKNLPPPRALSDAYDRLVTAGTISDDFAQRSVLAQLQQLVQALAQAPGSLVSRLFSRRTQEEAARSLYIWGNVGRGKSMLMDLFFEHAPVPARQRVHFHAFMQDIHARIHQIRQDSALSKSGIDPVIAVAREIASQSRLLCFDELQATDVADATLLYRLFEELFALGVVVVSTSNHPPASLYTGGIQKERFAKFIALIESHMEVVSLTSEQDYRHKQAASPQRYYYFPLNAGAAAFVEQHIQALGAVAPSHGALMVQGRRLPFTLYGETIGRFRFADLCETALGPADYLAIARRLRWLILEEIPALGPEKRNEAKRFVTLIDALYEHKVKLICTAACPPEQIYREGDGAFEFARTVSRLAEMQSGKWQRHA
jgi:cell division protein ZapE